MEALRRQRVEHEGAVGVHRRAHHHHVTRAVGAQGLGGRLDFRQAARARCSCEVGKGQGAGDPADLVQVEGARRASSAGCRRRQSTLKGTGRTRDVPDGERRQSSRACRRGRARKCRWCPCRGGRALVVVRGRRAPVWCGAVPWSCPSWWPVVGVTSAAPVSAGGAGGPRRADWSLQRGLRSRCPCRD